MNPIAAASSPSSMPSQETGGPLSLAERMLAQGRGTADADISVPDDTGAGEGALTPLPQPITDMQAAIAGWAWMAFKDRLMLGDEEETGVPPLSIDI